MSWQRIRGWVIEKQSRLLTLCKPAAVTHDPVAPLADGSYETGNRDVQQETLGKVILARLLLEIPQHRQAFLSSLQGNDHERLELCTHKLAGAVAYCELPELSAALDELRQALRTENEEQVRYTCNTAIHCMTALMESSGIKQT
ncbi:MAG: Hpt domain-containing protein [Gammaproteobacteria bacterium]|nr:Hpt domain-containing protein [Gammaproteobacteria bacterium]